MKIFITGGAGFIGSNSAHHFAAQGHDIIIYDNLSRVGGQANLDWLRQNHAARLTFVRGDVRDYDHLAQSIVGSDVVLHLASQVAVTTSVQNPREDFEINALGTFNVLEAVRHHAPQAAVLYASTNKVYGGMEDVGVVLQGNRYAYASHPHGIGEEYPLDFHSPYGCSKGTGDQYTIDYARIYGLKSLIFRQSCLAATQEIITPFGKKRMDALQAGDLVHSGCGWTRVRRVWSTGVKPVRRLRTMNGLTVTLTTDHRVVRPHGLFTNRDFAYGDFLAVLPEAAYMPAHECVSDRVLEPEELITAVHARTTDPRCRNEAERLGQELLPLTGDRLLAITEIVGRLFGDGHLGIHNRQSRQSPAYNVQHFGSEAELQEVSERLAWLGLPTSGIGRSSSTSTLPNGHVVEGTSCRIQQQTIPVFTLFELLGVPVGDKVRVAYGLPDWVANGHRLVKRAFLRGFFGAELCQVNANSYLAPSFAQSKDVTCRESGQQWIQQLRDLIAEFGIETSCFEAAPVDYKRGTTTQVTVRLLGGQEMFRKLAGIGYAFSAERSQRLNSLLRWMWTQTSAEHVERANELYRADGELYWDSLADVEELPEQPVYDLEVEADSHLLVAGGVQVSNCIYGRRQFGVEDQGWVAHFVIAAQLGRPISIFGDGRQVRDLLHVSDLIHAYELGIANIDQLAGRAINVGGGPRNTLSVWTEFGPLLAELAGHDVPISYHDWRPGDQRVFVADVRKAERLLGWQPTVSPEQGIRDLWAWVAANRNLFE
jgi:nucleoside-diphosphate-sugar epimerase